MYKKIISAILLTAFVLVMGSCSKDSEVVPDQPVVPAALTPGTDARPDWKAPDYSKPEYGLTMAVQVQLGDELADYQSGGDLMCAKVGGEVRALTTPMTTGGSIYYPLSIAGDGSDQKVSLWYYCDQLHRIYVIGDWAAFDASAAPTGTSGIYRPCFTHYYK